MTGPVGGGKPHSDGRNSLTGNSSGLADMAKRMTTSGKTLSVTYGDFSCLIQGYDAPTAVLAQVLDALQRAAGENPALGTRVVGQAEVAALSEAFPPAEISVSQGVLRLTVSEAAESGHRPAYGLSAEEIAAVAEPDIGESAEPAARLERDLNEDVSTPLLLLAAQRVDVPTPPPQMSLPPLKLMPHELSATKYPAISADRLKSVLAELAPASLTERMEAIAAYLMAVEGWTDFTRPALLDALSKSSTVPYPFEEELKSFGVLVREGRFRRLGEGRFAVSEDSAYFDDSHSSVA
ncbi:hypothetical protein CDV50_05875 [Haematobacter massiliensis]|uniref:Uncharacterized protein n=2 Tax=Haematobacter massiliensis TaxID=195105 RepID=A0A086YD88_9RHOB|nr:hypothetical protein CN97_06615 [Haematobacter massiliensis]OWJ72680.1 hypothetical protein CDV50_05875 [Haematobacter massiliensis]OWJ86818.1 hypothetical protein CDV51_09850 [Haematobacter massiliensis]